MLVLCGCSCEKEPWSCIVYPDRNDLTVHEDFGEWRTLEECRTMALGRLTSLHPYNPGLGDYECGLNCNGNPFVRTCKKTERYPESRSDR